MKKERISDNKKKIGRPSTGVGTLVGQRWHDDQLKQIDRWRRGQSDMPGRSEAIRRLVELGLTVKTKDRAKGEHPRQRAREMAGNAIDKITDTTASPNDQASRKQRLIKGPEEFQELRVDRPRQKR